MGVKAYTGGGDRGTTSLLSGERVKKSHCRIEACGEVDELNCALGALIASLTSESLGLRELLLEAQANLFRLGALLATSHGSAAASLLPRLGLPQTQRLEAEIDRLEAGLPPLQGFILPGGHPTAAWAHVARTVCRRAERRVVLCSLEEQDNSLEEAIAYLNRLSTLLFTVARLCNKFFGVAESVWRA